MPAVVEDDRPIPCGRCTTGKISTYLTRRHEEGRCKHVGLTLLFAVERIGIRVHHEVSKLVGSIEARARLIGLVCPKKHQRPVSRTEAGKRIELGASAIESYDNYPVKLKQAHNVRYR